MAQAGTGDPLLQCLHLDKCLLEQQNTKKAQGTKNNSLHEQLGQNMDKKIEKDKKPNCHRVSGAKAEYCACLAVHTHTTREVGKKPKAAL